MATLCDTTCGQNAEPKTAYDATCVIETRKIGAEYFFGVQCDANIDLTDPAAVASAMTAGTIKPSPRGKILKGRGESDKIEDAFGCGEDIDLNVKSLLTYETYSAKCDSTEDDEYWADFNDNFSNRRYFYVDCCGKIYADIGAPNPGFKANLKERFEFVEGEKGYGKWAGGFEIETKGTPIPLYDLAVLAALGLSVNVN